MTRLTINDIGTISILLHTYEQRLVTTTGKGLLAIACHAYGLEIQQVQQQVKTQKVAVVPVTTGQGIISGFADTVAAILLHLGFEAAVTECSDVGGVGEAYASQADILFMADDDFFLGLNLNTKKSIDNGAATGKCYAAALDLATGSVAGKKVLVLGCGPVGSATARALLYHGAEVTLFETQPTLAYNLRLALIEEYAEDRIHVISDLDQALHNHRLVVEATPAAYTIRDEQLKNIDYIALPGVPAGISARALQNFADRSLHDKLELGVAAMAISLLAPPAPPKS